MAEKPIPVTRPSLPPLDELLPYLEKIWETRVLTNGGPFHQELEQALCDHLGVPQISLFSNGTIALVVALQALDLKDAEVITTPYSFVATANSLMWRNLTPVFVDIDPETSNLDPAAIERAITPRTAAIMPVHCYGIPCDVEAIKAIADRRGLKVIYDAAHAFGVQHKGQSVLRHGDLSTLSFHATKVFNTFEGGAIVSPDLETKQRIDRLKNFGIVDEVTLLDEPGLNGKMSELQAAVGLAQLKHIGAALSRRAEVDATYRKALKVIPGIRTMDLKADRPNNAYFPILVGEGYPLSRDALYHKLRERQIFARRYFYPLITDFPAYRNLPSARGDLLVNARKLADEVLCLPLSSAMEPGEIDRVIAALTP